MEKYLKECIDSILDQTYTNFELILINDGSTDNCRNICDEYALKDKRVSVINKENTGVSESRNIGIMNANGKYLTFIDSDDYVSKYMLEIMYSDLKKNDADMAIVGRNIVNEQSENILLQKYKIKKILNSEQALKELMIEKNFNCVSWGKLYKKSLFNSYKFNINTVIAEDLEILYKIMSQCKTIVLDTTRGLYFWRNRLDSVTKSKYDDNWKKEMKITKEIIQYFDKENRKIKKYAMQRYVRIGIKCMYKAIEIGNIEEAKEIYKNIKPYIGIFLLSCNEKKHHKMSILLAIINFDYFVMLYKWLKKLN